MTKEERTELYFLADNEFKKYLYCLQNAKEGIEHGNKEKARHWLNVAALALAQSASFRSRKQFVHMEEEQ